jgi:hypothetical protein
VLAAGRFLEPSQQIGFTFAAEIIAGRGMSHDDDIRLDRCEQLDAAVDIVDHRAGSLVLALERAGGPV